MPFNIQFEENTIEQDATAVAFGGDASAENSAEINSDDVQEVAGYDGSDDDDSDDEDSDDDMASDDSDDEDSDDDMASDDSDEGSSDDMASTGGVNVQAEVNTIDQDATAVSFGGDASAKNSAEINSDDVQEVSGYGGADDSSDDMASTGGANVQAEVNTIDQNATAVSFGGDASAENSAEINSDDVQEVSGYGGYEMSEYFDWGNGEGKGLDFGPDINVQFEINTIAQNATAVSLFGDASAENFAEINSDDHQTFDMFPA